jgi:DNA-binding Lrp family transcriptional regulator
VAVPPVSVRLQRLIQRGFIKGIHADIARERVGYPICVYVMLRVTDPTGDHGRLSEHLLARPEVEEVAWLTGEFDVLVRAWVRDTTHLERLVVELNEIGGGRTTTMIVIGEHHRKPALDFEKRP